MSPSLNTAEKAIGETSGVIKYGLKYRPIIFLIFVGILVIGSLYGGYIYLSYLTSKEQIAANASTMNEQNKVISNGFKQSHDDQIKLQETQQKQLEIEEKIFNYLRYDRKSLED